MMDPGRGHQDQGMAKEGVGRAGAAASTRKTRPRVQWSGGAAAMAGGRGKTCDRLMLRLGSDGQTPNRSNGGCMGQEKVKLWMALDATSSHTIWGADGVCTEYKKRYR